MSVKFVVFVVNTLGYNYLMSGKSHGIEVVKYKLRPKFIDQHGENNMLHYVLAQKARVKVFLNSVHIKVKECTSSWEV